MTRAELVAEIQQKQSYLCVGLDTDFERLPTFLKEKNKAEAILEFNKAIIEATQDLCVAYKPNLAFYEALGAEGWEVLKETMKFIPKNIFIIADAKRGDIGNTAKKYAQTFFEYFDFDAVTLSPYMGEDSIKPFLEYPDKWAIVLVLTSNASSQDFQTLSFADESFLFEQVIQKTQTWENADRIMFVVGATKADALQKIRELAPDSFLLIPGVGAQGGSLEEVSRWGLNQEAGLLVNSSRGILYASEQEDFAEKAREKALKLQEEMKGYLGKDYVKLL